VLVARDGRVVFLEARLSRMGESADRTSRFFRWEVRMTPAEVARSMRRYGSVGVVRDILPRRIGTSGRVVDLAIVGSEGELLLKGMKVRFALGLRENLFVIDRELDDDKRVEQFVFTGKGWGHGVGLCQVGAYGMARSGSTYAQILSHYYPGTALDTLH
jgi:SpoIID/LytB domain protein